MFLSRHPFWTTFGTVLGSILGAFWEHKSTLYSVLVDLGCKWGAQKQWGGRGCVLWCPGCPNGPFCGVPPEGGKPTYCTFGPRARRSKIFYILLLLLAVLLYYCITVLQYCILLLLLAVLLYCCITALLYYCITVLLYYCIIV